MKRSTKIGITAAVAVLLVAGVAIAAWLATGSGSGQAKAGEVTIAVNAGTAPGDTGDLYPDGTGLLYLSVTNTSTVPLVVTDVAGSGPIVSDDEANCPASNVQFADQTSLTEPALPVSTDPVTFTVPGVTMDATAPSECQNVVFTIPVTVTASTP